jgi:hypothetical protein
MKASELIGKLQELIGEEGDLSCYFLNDGMFDRVCDVQKNEDQTREAFFEIC